MRVTAAAQIQRESRSLIAAGPILLQRASNPGAGPERIHPQLEGDLQVFQTADGQGWCCAALATTIGEGGELLHEAKLERSGPSSLEATARACTDLLEGLPRLAGLGGTLWAQDAAFTGVVTANLRAWVACGWLDGSNHEDLPCPFALERRAMWARLASALADHPIKIRWAGYRL